MPRSFAALVCLVSSALFLSAQEPAQSQPRGKTATPTVTYVSDWRAQDPPLYSIAVDSTGRATYHSQPAADPNGGTAPEPYSVEWTATEATRSRIFDLAQKANYFEGNFTSKAKVADTGLKTLHYEDQSRDNSANYNYSDNPAVRELTELFQSIETTAEIGRKLQYEARYNKLAIDQDLKYLQQAQRSHEASEFGSVEPILQQIANDTSMLRMAQQRAAAILRTAGLPVEQAQK